jgi:hypothetical protein
LTRELVNFEVTKLPDLDEKIISFFSEYPIIGVKAKDFSDFCVVAKLMKNGFHLTQEGLPFRDHIYIYIWERRLRRSSQVWIKVEDRIIVCL